MNIVDISLAHIEEDKDQPRYRFDEEALQELMNSIEELGLLSPIKVRAVGNGRYKIIYGNRRYKACQMLRRETIPCIVSDMTDQTDIYLEQVAENLTREGFSPIEEAEAYDKLMNDSRFKSSLKFLSAKLGKPESYIRNKCELLKFSNAVKRLIVSGTEIRKDRLTEEQLMPLKDLPMEHRDPLALLAAKDELPVSDVKKIAKLFKDKTISSGTKDKLLLKSGSGLIETWSVYEQNRKERAKQEAEAKEAEIERQAEQQRKAEDKEAKTSAHSAEPIGGSGATFAAPLSAPAAGESHRPAAGGAAPGQPDNAAGVASPNAADGLSDADGQDRPAAMSGFAWPNADASIADMLHQYVASLAVQAQLAQRLLQAVALLPEVEQAEHGPQASQAIQQLEQQLAQWKMMYRNSPSRPS